MSRREDDGQQVILHRLSSPYRGRIFAAEIPHHGWSSIKALKKYLIGYVVLNVGSAGPSRSHSKLAAPGDSKLAVPVDRRVLETAAKNTGIVDYEQLVDYALKLLADADPSADFARENRGVLRDLHLDV